MKLEKGIYVRTRLGVGQITYVSQYDVIVNLNKHYSDLVLPICEENIKKTSYNIIDLIEVGDYVNGELVQDITGEYIRIGNISHNKSWLSNNIKTILTKEQFENECYKVGD